MEDLQKSILKYINEQYFEKTKKIHELLFNENQDLWNLVDKVRIAGYIDAMMDLQTFIESLK